MIRKKKPLRNEHLLDLGIMPESNLPEQNISCCISSRSKEPDSYKSGERHKFLRHAIHEETGFVPEVIWCKMHHLVICTITRNFDLPANLLLNGICESLFGTHARFSQAKHLEGGIESDNLVDYLMLLIKDLSFDALERLDGYTLEVSTLGVEALEHRLVQSIHLI